MLQWNLDYYLRKKDVSWNFQYKFFFPPFISDLALLPEEGHIFSQIDSTKKDASILRQLLMIIHPKRIDDHVPAPYNALIRGNALSKFSPDKPIFYPDGNTIKSKHFIIKIKN